MSYVTKLELVQNDYGYDLEFKLEDAEGNPVSLLGATAIKLFIAEPDADVAKVVDDCTPTDEEGGLCKYTVKDGDFDEQDKIYEVEIEVTYATKVITAKGTKITILPEAPETKS